MNMGDVKEVEITDINGMSDTFYEAIDRAFRAELRKQGKNDLVIWEFWTLKATCREGDVVSKIALPSNFNGVEK